MIDLIDERFNLLEVEPSRYCTASSKFVATGALTELPNHTVIQSGSEQFLRYWKAGWRALVQLLESHDKLSKVRISKVFWQKETTSGTAFRNLSVKSIESANVMLRAMYEYMAGFLEPHQFFKYDEWAMRCSDTHKWGPAPFHYSEDFCKEVLGYLTGASRQPKRIP